MNRRDEPLVSVVIPAFNAERTLDATLSSARAQTHAGLEIIVVDDGSTDATWSLASRHARADPRVKIIRQANSGVAAARNAAAAVASGQFLAPLDADDLWHPEKIELQLSAFSRAGSRCGLVYTWFALLDEHGRITHKRPGSIASGDVLPALAVRNFIGNGSTALIPVAVFRGTTGYDPTLRERGGQGCEDWKLYLEIAERWRFAVVPEHLTGYRVSPHNMSSDAVQMLRSRDIATAEFVSRHPELAPALRSGRNRLARFLFNRALTERRLGDAVKVAVSMARDDPLYFAAALAALPKTAADRLFHRHAKGVYRAFYLPTVTVAPGVAPSIGAGADLNGGDGPSAELEGPHAPSGA